MPVCSPRPPRGEPAPTSSNRLKPIVELVKAVTCCLFVGAAAPTGTDLARLRSVIASTSASPAWTNTIGPYKLGGVWFDADFDPTKPASPYARVIDIPTPRLTASDAIKFNLTLPNKIPAKGQERACTVPI